jgi:hypothetical protein
MKTIRFEDRESWMKFRLGKITGTRLKDVVVKKGTGEKAGFYEIIAERLTKPDYVPEVVGENAMIRGQRLEERAMQAFVAKTGKEVDSSLIMWVSDQNEYMALSPDGAIGDTEGVEIKCLAGGKHVEAFLTQKIPSDYYFQALDYFIINEKLQTLYFCFYNPSLIVHEFFYIEMHRADVIAEIEEYYTYQVQKLSMIDNAVKLMLSE